MWIKKIRFQSSPVYVNLMYLQQITSRRLCLGLRQLLSSRGLEAKTCTKAFECCMPCVHERTQHSYWASNEKSLITEQENHKILFQRIFFKKEYFGLYLYNPVIVVKTYHSVLLFASSFLAQISSIHIDKVLAWLSFRKIYVLKASFIKNLLQITDINFLPTTSEPNGF